MNSYYYFGSKDYIKAEDAPYFLDFLSKDSIEQLASKLAYTTLSSDSNLIFLVLGAKSSGKSTFLRGNSSSYDSSFMLSYINNLCKELRENYPEADIQTKLGVTAFQKGFFDLSSTFQKDNQVEF